MGCLSACRALDAAAIAFFAWATRWRITAASLGDSGRPCLRARLAARIACAIPLLPCSVFHHVLSRLRDGETFRNGSSASNGSGASMPLNGSSLNGSGALPPVGSSSSSGRSRSSPLAGALPPECSFSGESLPEISCFGRRVPATSGALPPVEDAGAAPPEAGAAPPEEPGVAPPESVRPGGGSAGCPRLGLAGLRSRSRRLSEDAGVLPRLRLEGLRLEDE